MGSKLHQINRLFTTLKRNNCNVVAVGLKTKDTRTAVSDNTTLKAEIAGGLKQHKVSMDGLLECDDRDSVRNTMLKHDEIFRHQVQELHRLYRVQKVLMTELGKKKVSDSNLHHFPAESAAAAAAAADVKTRIWSNTASTSDTSRSSQVSNVHQSAPCGRRTGLSSRELSICSRDQSIVHVRGFDLEQPAEEYTSRGEVRSTDERPPAVHGKQLSWSDDGSEIELTLSIGCGPNKKKRTHSLHPDVDIGCSDPIPGSGGGDSSTGLDRESLKSPPWLLQALNLNKT